MSGMQLGLSGKVFLVTAATGGLALAATQALVAEGAGVLLISKSQERLDSLVSQLGGAQQAIGLAAELDDEYTAEQAVSIALETFGRLDGALLSASATAMGSVLDIDDQTWRDSFDQVFVATLRMARQVVSANPAARLGFVLSTSAKIPLGGMAVSNGVRPGLAMVLKQLADEIGPTGGRAFGIIPGAFATPRQDELARTDPEAAERRAAAEANIPLRRYGRPAEFGQLAAFLLSDAASYLTGCLVPVDGGALRAL